MNVEIGVPLVFLIIFFIASCFQPVTANVTFLLLHLLDNLLNFKPSFFFLFDFVFSALTLCSLISFSFSLFFLVSFKINFGYFFSPPSVFLWLLMCFISLCACRPPTVHLGFASAAFCLQ